MNESSGHGRLLLIIGELLYKNELLREALVSKDQTFDLIINHLMNAKVAACPCGVGSQLAFIREAVKSREPDVLCHGSCRFDETDEIALSTTETSVGTTSLPRAEPEER